MMTFMKFFISFLIVIIFSSCTPKLGVQDICGDWYYKSAKIHFTSNYIVTIDNPNEDLNFLEYKKFTGKWRVVDNEIHIIGKYSFILFVNSKDRLYYYVGDPDDYNIIVINKNN